MTRGSLPSALAAVMPGMISEAMHSIALMPKDEAWYKAGTGEKSDLTWREFRKESHEGIAWIDESEFPTEDICAAPVVRNDDKEVDVYAWLVAAHRILARREYQRPPLGFLGAKYE